MKYSKEEKAKAWEQIKKYRGLTVYATVNSVSRSGMSRRIGYYVCPEKNEIVRIGWLIAQIADYGYDIDKGGIRADGCGMDMIFSVLSNFNYAAAQLDTGKTIRELLDDPKKPAGERIYDKYFFNASYSLL